MSILNFSLILSACVIAFLFIYLLVIFQQLLRLKKQTKTLDAQILDESEKAQGLLVELTEVKNQFNKNILYDALTGLPSRQVFEDRLLQTVNQSKRHQLLFGILFLDIDGFKVINDALGYEVGDELLKQVSVRLLSAVRQVDTVSRFSGDDFVLLLPQIAKPETCVFIMQRLLDSLSQPFTVMQHELFITASVGIAVFPGDGEEGKIVLKNAANALHQAQIRGSNGYQFYRQEMQQTSQRELMLNTSLRHASVYHEFSILYQPQVNIRTKEVTCMEALLRWQHPSFGLVTPNDFLRLAENSGKIIEIGEWVLRTVCHQFQKWKKMNFHLQKVAVNISLKQLENPHFIYKLSRILHETNMGPESLVLEISEGVFHKIELLEKCLQMLKHIGVQIAINDFGTGHLSLQQIKRLSIDYLKIDSSLIQDITSNPESEAIVKMVIVLAKTLHHGIVAVGVETAQQKGLLEKLGCDVMQGHLFSIPRSADEFTLTVEKMIGEA